MLYEISRVLKCEAAELMPREAGRDPQTGWITDAQVLHGRHPRLFKTLMALPEDGLTLLLISVQAACDLPVRETAETGV